MDIAHRIKRWNDIAETLSDDCAWERRSKPGPKPSKRPQRPTRPRVFICGSEAEIDEALKIACAAMGPRKRGAKQWAFAGLYVDLAGYCLRLKKSGIRAPRGGSLSKRAAMGGLAEILRRHGYLSNDEPDEVLLDSARREAIGRMLANQFGRIAEAIAAQNTPK